MNSKDKLLNCFELLSDYRDKNGIRIFRTQIGSSNVCLIDGELGDLYDCIKDMITYTTHIQCGSGTDLEVFNAYTFPDTVENIERISNVLINNLKYDNFGCSFSVKITKIRGMVTKYVGDVEEGSSLSGTIVDEAEKIFLQYGNPSSFEITYDKDIDKQTRRENFNNLPMQNRGILLHHLKNNINRNIFLKMYWDKFDGCKRVQEDKKLIRSTSPDGTYPRIGEPGTKSEQKHKPIVSELLRTNNGTASTQRSLSRPQEIVFTPQSRVTSPARGTSPKRAVPPSDAFMDSLFGEKKQPSVQSLNDDYLEQNSRVSMSSNGRSLSPIPRGFNDDKSPSYMERSTTASSQSSYSSNKSKSLKGNIVGVFKPNVKQDDNFIPEIPISSFFLPEKNMGAVRRQKQPDGTYEINASIVHDTQRKNSRPMTCDFSGDKLCGSSVSYNYGNFNCGLCGCRGHNRGMCRCPNCEQTNVHAPKDCPTINPKWKCTLYDVFSNCSCTMRKICSECEKSPLRYFLVAESIKEEDGFHKYQMPLMISTSVKNLTKISEIVSGKLKCGIYSNLNTFIVNSKECMSDLFKAKLSELHVDPYCIIRVLASVEFFDQKSRNELARYIPTA